VIPTAIASAGAIVIARNEVAKQSSLQRRVSFDDLVGGAEDWISSLRSQ
jgi:hypothetical protein